MNPKRMRKRDFGRLQKILSQHRKITADLIDHLDQEGLSLVTERFKGEDAATEFDLLWNAVVFGTQKWKGFRSDCYTHLVDFWRRYYLEGNYASAAMAMFNLGVAETDLDFRVNWEEDLLRGFKTMGGVKKAGRERRRFSKREIERLQREHDRIQKKLPNHSHAEACRQVARNNRNYPFTFRGKTQIGCSAAYLERRLLINLYSQKGTSEK